MWHVSSWKVNQVPRLAAYFKEAGFLGVWCDYAMRIKWDTMQGPVITPVAWNCIQSCNEQRDKFQGTTRA